MFGFLNVYKPTGITSHDVVSRLRKIIGMKQIGHTGTLDPFAEGVLPICVGKATRLIEYLDDDKAYEGIIQFGKSSTTYDKDGEILETSGKLITENELISALNDFRGEIEQKPPIFSAIKIKGKKLYEYARAGETVEVPIRKITIYKLELLEFDYSKQQAKVYIECSKGTYIRSIANDLGEVLGCFGYLEKLTRVKAGKFVIDKSCPLESINTENVGSLLFSPLEILDFRKYQLDDNTVRAVKNGMRIKANGFSETEFAALVYNSELISVARFEKGAFVQKKVLG